MQICLFPISVIWNKWTKYDISNAFKLKVVHSKAAQPEEKFIEVNGRRICYVKTGRGPHNVLCIPGFLCAWDGFDIQVAGGLDQNKFTVVAVDPPGFGKSLPLDRKDPPEAFIEDAKIFHNMMEKLSLVPYSIIGWSDGGTTAIYMAHQQRKKNTIRKVLLFGAISFVSKAMIADGAVIGNLSLWPEEMTAPIKKWGNGLDYAQRTWDSHERCYKRILKENNGDMCNGLLKEIPNDVLVIHGAADTTVPLENAWFINENLPCSCGLLIAPGAGHGSHITHAKWFNEMATQFLTSPYRCSDKTGGLKSNIALY